MTKLMLIDASHVEETRVAVLDKTKLEDFDFETSTKKQLKGNIYLGRVTRVEPSLQAAFIEFGGNRHGFLAFNELHPDYYRVPVADQEKLLMFERKAEALDEGREEGDISALPEEVLAEKNEVSSGKKPKKSYKIQDVIRRRQVILVQVLKEERGAKGAALTSYISLAGRYCVLMPNTPRGIGVSRKISNVLDRQRLRGVVESLSLPAGMGLIVRTAGMGRTKTEIKRDSDYLLRLWEQIREEILTAKAPALIYAEGNLITRSIRDLYSKEISDIYVEGEEGYKKAKAFMRMLMPSHSKRIHLYKDSQIPLFQRYQVEEKIDSIHSPEVQLPSGGSLIISPTEALVAIDVNSGKATKERHIEETAFKTNLEAADEIAAQLRLRDLAGLIVVDFIDMETPKNNTAVEQRFRQATKLDRARIQVGNISSFGLLEMSRQRLRPSLLEASTAPCLQCRGTGVVRSVESSALRLLRALESEGSFGKFLELVGYVPSNVALYVLNQKRAAIGDLEFRYGITVTILEDEALFPPDFRIERFREKPLPFVAESDSVQATKEVLSSDSEEPASNSETVEDQTSESVVVSSETSSPPVGNLRSGSRKGRFRGKGSTSNHKTKIVSQDLGENFVSSDTPIVEELQDNKPIIPIRKRHLYGKHYRARNLVINSDSESPASVKDEGHLESASLVQRSVDVLKEVESENGHVITEIKRGWWDRWIE